MCLSHSLQPRSSIWVRLILADRRPLHE